MSPDTPRALERPCPACGAADYVPFANERIDPNQVNEFTYSSRKQPEFMCLRLVRCKRCDLVYAPTPPEQSFLASAYAEAAYDSAAEAHSAARSYAQALAPFLSELAKGNAAVDVGAGSGPLLPWLVEEGFQPVIGVEPSHAAVESAPPQIRPMLREGMFSKELLAGVEPSLVCSFMTMEHISTPGTFVREAYDMLVPGGILALVVHNWRAPLNQILGLRSPIIDVEHLQLFSPGSMSRLLGSAGFDDIRIQSIRNSYPLKYWLRLTPLPARLKGLLMRFLVYVRLDEAHLGLRVGNLLAVGTKPLKEKK